MSNQVAGRAATIVTIQQKETAVAEKIQAARDAAEAAVVGAHQKANQQITKAEQTGREAGETAYKQALAEVEQEASAYLQAIQTKANQMAENSQTSMETAVKKALGLVIGAT